MRIIPKKTKVSTEFFTGVSTADILVGAVGVILLFFIVLSNLPHKLGICGGVVLLFAMLLVRIDDEPNYMFLLRIIKHLSYHRYYKKMKHEDAEETVEAEETYYEPEEMSGEEIIDEGVA